MGIEIGETAIAQSRLLVIFEHGVFCQYVSEDRIRESIRLTRYGSNVIASALRKRVVKRLLELGLNRGVREGCPYLKLACTAPWVHGQATRPVYHERKLQVR